MAVTRERIGADPRTDERKGHEHRPPAPDGVGRSPLDGSLSTGWARTVAVAWIGFFVALPAIEPPPAEPAAAAPTYAVLLSTLLFGLLAMTAAGLVTQRRWSLASSMGAGLILGGMVVACPVSGHHGFGMWWLGEMALVIALLGVSLVGLRRA